MKVARQIWIDKHLFKPLVISLNLWVRLLGKILRIDHRLDKPFTKIAVCKYKGMGSIIQATPLLSSLKKRYPNAKISFITTPSNVELLQLTGLVDEIITLNDRSAFTLLKSFPSFWWKLFTRRYEVYIDLEIYSNFSSFVTTWSMAKNRLGYYLRSSNYRMGVYTQMMFFNVQAPISECYLQMARALGCTDLQTDLHHFSNFLSHYEAQLPSKPYFVINPNASDLRVERKWSPDNFIKLTHHLLQLFPEHEIYYIGSKNEADYVNTIVNVINHERVSSWCGKTDIKKLIFYISKAEALITNDTGPMHIGFSLQTPTLALFGPCSPQHYGFNAAFTKILYRQIYCSPCVHEFEIPPCNGDNQCMKLIKIEAVLQALLD